VGSVWSIPRIPCQLVPIGVGIVRYISFSNADHLSSHSTLKVTKVNTWGLVYHFQGSDDTLKPILFAAHQGDISISCIFVIQLNRSLVDVVPVNPDTVDQWAHPPYSGYFDGMYC
jgi:hypothetical protein